MLSHFRRTIFGHSCRQVQRKQRSSAQFVCSFPKSIQTKKRGANNKWKSSSATAKKFPSALSLLTTSFLPSVSQILTSFAENHYMEGQASLLLHSCTSPGTRGPERPWNKSHGTRLTPNDSIYQVKHAAVIKIRKQAVGENELWASLTPTTLLWLAARKKIEHVLSIW